MCRLLYVAICACLLCACLLVALTVPTANMAEEKTAPPAKVEGQTVPEGDLKALVQGNNEFAFDLYARLARKEGNVVFSPYSISTALGMTYAGARGETAAQMAKVLHFTLDQDHLHPAAGALMADLHGDDRKRPYQLHVANRLWGQKGFPFVQEFLELTRKEYGGGFKEVDFEGDTETARLTINRWVEEQTSDKIKELLQPPDVSEKTRLVLTNAIYFKADWKKAFPREQTREGDFEVAPGKKVAVSMMRHKEGKFGYYSGDGFQWLELPYIGDRLSMVLLLPQQKGQLVDLEGTLTAAAIARGVEKLQVQPVTVVLPRFKVTLRCLLNEELTKMGMTRAFTDADFSGIGSGLKISKVIHEAFIDVDEVGTEAAAATAVIMDDAKVRSFSFKADHPFLFLIRDRQTGSILFLGRMTDPRR